MQRPDDDPARHLAHAVAAGAAACQTMGAAPPSREAVRSLLDKVQVERV
jgi:fructose-1-phosphate kinase PfkB-like protein